MGLPSVEDLSAYKSNKIEQSDVVTIGKDFDQTYADLMSSEKNGASFHKSLDFSNVGMPTVNSKAGTNGSKFLRQFHQMRLFIQDYGGMLSHGEESASSINSTYLISSNLPESFSYSVGSNWTKPFGSFSNSQVNALLQLGGSKVINNLTNDLTGNANIGNNFQSTNNRVSSLMVWNGSEPLRLTLKIPVIDDGYYSESSISSGIRTNFVEALEFLGCLCLPKAGQGSLGFYQPPPSPYDFSYTSFTKDKQGKINGIDNSNSFSTSGNHVRILLQLGGMLLVDNVIVTNISVSYPNTKTMIRHSYKAPLPNPGDSNSQYLTPLLADLTINLTTCEAITANTYSNMLWLKQQRNQGSFSVTSQDLDEGKALMSTVWKNISDSGKKD